MLNRSFSKETLTALALRHRSGGLTAHCVCVTLSGASSAEFKVGELIGFSALAEIYNAAVEDGEIL